MTNRALKDWSTVISALGKGIQTILIRRRKIITEEGGGRYGIAHNEFALYPTYGHQKESFKDQYHNLFEEAISSRPREDVRIEYLARCEEIIEVSDLEKFRRLSDYYIWTEEHVERYFENTEDRKLYILILRVYKLPEPKIIEEAGGMTWVTLPYSIPIQECTPVLNDEKFNQTKAEIKGILEISYPPVPQLEITCPPRVNMGDEIIIRITANGRPVERVNVLINDNSFGMTNTNGEISYIFNESGSFTLTATKDGYASVSVNVEVQESEPEREHEKIKREIKEIGEILNFVAKEEEWSPDEAYRHDVTWRDFETHAPFKVFEVEFSRNIDHALSSLLHAYHNWRPRLCLVILDERNGSRVSRLVEPRIRGSFREIARSLKVYTKEQIDSLYQNLRLHRTLLQELTQR